MNTVMNKKGIVVMLLCLLISSVSYAQGRKGLRINEVMVQNQNNFVDDYGMHHAWIELYNSTYGSMEISSVFLTNDKNNPTKYPIPRGDINTDIAPRQHTLFWADGEPERGTFHLNFTLEPGKDNWIGLYDADGRTLIDEVVIPASLGVDQSYALNQDGVSGDPSAWGIRDGSNSHYITPSSNNIIIDKNVKKQKFEDSDEWGFAMTIMAMCVVFTALLLLSLSFLGIGSLGKYIANKNKLKAQGIDPEKADDIKLEGDNGEEIAALCMALYEHLNAHDNEDTVLTINKVKRAYSPWSSKIYTLRELPHR